MTGQSKSGARRWIWAVWAGAVALTGALFVLAGDGRVHADPSTSRTGELQSATFAAGCFWCIEKDFDKLTGVVETISGYTGGQTPDPTYETVGRGGTGHTEALLVRFDPAQISYEALLDHYWRNVDLLDGDGQFCDRGDQYRPAIFTHDTEQARLAAASKAALASSGRFNQPIAVTIEAATRFYTAEDYHQGYYQKNPLRYRVYRAGCGRDARLRQLWGDEAGGQQSGLR